MKLAMRLNMSLDKTGSRMFWIISLDGAGPTVETAANGCNRDHNREISVDSLLTATRSILNGRR